LAPIGTKLAYLKRWVKGKFMETRPTIFIVDDEKEMCNLLKDFLGKQGYHVHSFLSPLLALNELRQDKKPAVIFSDIHMGTMNGIEFLKILKKDFPEIPVFMITASSDLDTLEQAKKLGATQCFIKPFPLQSLHTAISKVISAASRI